jgi:hypothetical protein
MKSTLIIASAVVLSISFTSCGNSQDHSKSETTAQNISDKKSEPVVLDKYLEIKNALVQTDGESASKAASELVESIGDNPDELMQKIRFDAQHIADTENTDHQRDHFNTLSDNIYQWVKATEGNEQKLYRQYCPMAFDNQGAYWLSAEKEVNNPYFGDKMLHCGSVKEEL